MTNKQRILYRKATIKLLKPFRSIGWKMLYRLAHKIDDANDQMRTRQVMRYMKQIGMLVYPRGRKTKNLARKIRSHIFEFLYDSGNDIIIYNYEITNAGNRLKFADAVLRDLHKKMALDMPQILGSFVGTEKYPSAPDGYYAAYHSVDKVINFGDHGLNDFPLDIFMEMIIHEYVHVLDDTFSTTMPKMFSRFEKLHPDALEKIWPGDRAEERIAMNVANMASRNFIKNYDKFLESRE